jgi:hypothetical protein
VGSPVFFFKTSVKREKRRLDKIDLLKILHDSEMNKWAQQKVLEVVNSIPL